MRKVKVLLAGVFKYSENIADNLPFCKNDIDMMNMSLSRGLGIKASNISILGKNGIISEKEFVAAVNILCESVTKDDTIIVYFTGHAQIIDNSHYLCLSNSILDTNQFIKHISGIECKSKIIIIDACYCSIEKLCSPSIYSLENILKNIGKGTIVVTSSAIDQKSYFIPELNVSTFTYFLCSALTNDYLAHNGKKSIYKLLYTAIMYTDLYYRHNLKALQEPQLSSNIIGDLLFDIGKSHISNNYFYRKSFKKYSIHSIKPLHNSELKRYCIKAILKMPMSYNDIEKISRQIVNYTKKLNIFSNDIQKKKWKNKDTDIIYIYFYICKNDADNCHHMCQISWFREHNSLLQYTKLHNINYKNSHYCFEINDNYSIYKTLNLTHNIPNETYMNYLKSSFLELVNIGESITNCYNQLINKSISINEYLKYISSLSSRIKSLFLQNSDNVPPHELLNIDTLYSELLSVLYDLVCIADVEKKDNITMETEKFICKYKEILTNDKILEYIDTLSS